MKRMLCLWLSVCLLAGLCALPVAAEEAVLTTDAFDEEVRYSVTDSNITGWGLAFCFTLNATNVKKSSTNQTILTNATLDYAGETCAITRIGAVVTHLSGLAKDDQQMVREAAAERGQVTDIRAAKLCAGEDTFCTYAIRIIDIPFEREEQLLYARPYVEILYQGEKITLYGATDAASYAEKAGTLSIDLPYYGMDVDGKGRLFVGDTSVLENTLYIEIQDELDEWMTMYNPDRPDTIYYACYDANGVVLPVDGEKCGAIYIRDMSSRKATDTFAVLLPEGTVEVRIVGAEIIYWTEWE